MRKTLHLGRTTLLAALVAVLSMVCVAKHTHTARVSHAGLHHPTLPHSPRHRGAGNSRRSRGNVVVGDHADASVDAGHGAGAGSFDLAAVNAASTLRFARQSTTVRFPQAHELALGGAPRAPGTTRGPPVLL